MGKNCGHREVALARELDSCGDGGSRKTHVGEADGMGLATAERFAADEAKGQGTNEQ
jgi:hypothetical protein